METRNMHRRLLRIATLALLAHAARAADPLAFPEADGFGEGERVRGTGRVRQQGEGGDAKQAAMHISRLHNGSKSNLSPEFLVRRAKSGLRGAARASIIG